MRLQLLLEKRQTIAVFAAPIHKPGAFGPERSAPLMIRAVPSAHRSRLRQIPNHHAEFNVGAQGRDQGFHQSADDSSSRTGTLG